MATTIYLTPSFAVSAQITAGDVERLAREGFRAIVAVRPDGEDPAGPASEVIAAQAQAHGLAFRYAPASAHALTETETVRQFEAALADTRGPVLAYCKSGQRAAIVWALAAARYQPVACVGAVLHKAGVDPELIEDELAAQNGRHRGRRRVRPASLAVECAAGA